MRKPRDFDAELKALGDKARDLKSRKVQQLGELVGLGSTLQSLLHPTGYPLESNGPLSPLGPAQNSAMR